MTATYKSLLLDYIEDPSADRLLCLQHAVASAPNFDTELLVLKSAEQAYTDGAFNKAVELLEAVMPGALLSPAVHSQLSNAFRQLGQVDSANRHEGLARVALASVLHSGDGTRHSPYLVLRIRDEYDVMKYLELVPVAQQTQEVEGQVRDVLVTQSGREVHFRLISKA